MQIVSQSQINFLHSVGLLFHLFSSVKYKPFFAATAGDGEGEMSALGSPFFLVSLRAFPLAIAVTVDEYRFSALFSFDAWRRETDSWFSLKRMSLRSKMAPSPNRDTRNDNRCPQVGMRRSRKVTPARLLYLFLFRKIYEERNCRSRKKIKQFNLSLGMTRSPFAHSSSVSSFYVYSEAY